MSPDARKSPMTEDSPHGRGGYNRGCRCEVCREANRAYGKEYMRTRRWTKRRRRKDA